MYTWIEQPKNLIFITTFPVQLEFGILFRCFFAHSSKTTWDGMQMSTMNFCSGLQHIYLNNIKSALVLVQWISLGFIYLIFVLMILGFTRQPYVIHNSLSFNLKLSILPKLIYGKSIKNRLVRPFAFSVINSSVHSVRNPVCMINDTESQFLIWAMQK